MIHQLRQSRSPEATNKLGGPSTVPRQSVRGDSVKLYVQMLALMSALLITLFVIVEGLEAPLLTQPELWLNAKSPLAAWVSFGLMASDIVLPVPSSFVMISNGALFGVFWGTMLSLVGGLTSSAIGFALGRSGSSWVARRRPSEESQRAMDLLRRWGGLTVVVSRPIPILSESVSVLAGTTKMSWSRFLSASCAGSLPSALIYAWTGSTAERLDSFVLIFVWVLAVSGLFWFVGSRKPFAPQKGDESEIEIPQHS